MTTPIKTLAFAAAASMLLLSCNNTGLNTEDNNPNAAKGKELKQPPNDPAVVIIEDNVQKWINEQLASKIGEKRLIMVSDMHLDDSEAPGLSASYNSAGEAEYYLNGQKISSQEYMRIWQEYDMKKNKGKRNLSIPGEIISDDSRSWTVLITAEELAGLTKKYGELAISFYTEPTNEDVPVSGGNGTHPMIPVVPPSILGCPPEDLEKEGKYPLPKNDPLPPNDRDGLPPLGGVCDASVLKLSAEELSFDAQGGVRCVTSSGYITLGGGGNGCREERMLVSDTINNPPQFINVNSFKRLVCPWFTATDVGLSKEGRRTLHISVNQNETGKERETSVYYSLGNCDSGLKITQAK